MEEDRLLSAMAGTGAGFFVVDATYQIVLWNTGAERLLGVGAREVLGRPCPFVLRGRGAVGQIMCRIPCRPMQLLEAGTPPSHFPLVVATNGDGECSVDMTLLPLPEGRVAHVFHPVQRQVELDQFVAQIRRAIASLTDPEHTMAPPVVDQRAPVASLTARERQVLRLLAEGMDTAGIAARLVVSRSTARKHIQSVLAKLRAHSRLEAVTIATRAKLLP